MHQFGSKDRFATVVGPSSNSLRHVEVWAAGLCLTPVDQKVYVPSFSAAVRRTLALLSEPARFERYRSLFAGRSVASSFRKLLRQSHPQAWRDLSILHWGPTTDEVVCFLVPVSDQVYLAWHQRGQRKIHRISLTPSEMATVLTVTLAELDVNSAQAE